MLTTNLCGCIDSQGHADTGVHTVVVSKARSEVAGGELCVLVLVLDHQAGAERIQTPAIIPQGARCASYDQLSCGTASQCHPESTANKVTTALQWLDEAHQGGADTCAYPRA